MKNTISDAYRVSLASSEADLRAVQRLRYDVFIRELGGKGKMVDHDAQLEKDQFDPYFDHLILRHNESDQIVGVYRLLRGEQAREIDRYYSEDEYDLNVLKSSGRRLLELGRSCLHKDHRGGIAMFQLWKGLAAYIARHKIEVLFGVASFHGTDIAALAHPLSLLHHRHLAPTDLRVRAHAEHFQKMDLVAAQDLDRRRVMIEIPALIKAYLRLGGFVGEGAFVDHEFNTVDVCLVMDTRRMNTKQSNLYRRK